MDWQDIPSLSALRAFEAACRHGTLSAAARELNVTHAAVAQHVRTLEDDFGVPLLIRQGRGVVPTAAGLTLSRALHSGFQDIATGVSRLRSDQSQRPLTISATPVFAGNWLMPRIGTFWARYPEISVTIHPSIDLVDLRKDGIDLAIRYGTGNWPGLNAQILTSGDFWVVAHPDLLKGRKASSVAEVRDLPWILENWSAERYRLLKLTGEDPDTLEIREFATSDLAFSALKAKLGVMILSRSVVENDVASGQLVRVCTISQSDLGYYIVTLPGRIDARLQKFIGWLTKMAAIAD